jgi:hypothetical protein
MVLTINHSLPSSTWDILILRRDSHFDRSAFLQLHVVAVFISQRILDPQIAMLFVDHV